MSNIFPVGTGATPAFCVIGVGPWGTTIARKINSETKFQMKGYFDVNDNILVEDCTRFNNLSEALNCGATHYVVTTPHDTHFDIAKKIVEKGSHVLVAKPLAPDYKSCAKLIDLSLDKGVTLMMGHTTLHDKAIQKLREILDSSSRRVISINTIRCGVGRVQNNDVALDLTIHDIANVIYLTGLEPISGKTDYINYGPFQGVESRTKFEYENGMVSNHISSWISPYRERKTRVLMDGLIVEYNELDKSITTYETTSGEEIASRGFISDVKGIERDFSDDPLLRELEVFVECSTNAIINHDNHRISAAAVKAVYMARDSR